MESMENSVNERFASKDATFLAPKGSSVGFVTCTQVWTRLAFVSVESGNFSMYRLEMAVFE